MKRTVNYRVNNRKSKKYTITVIFIASIIGVSLFTYIFLYSNPSNILEQTSILGTTSQLSRQISHFNLSSQDFYHYGYLQRNFTCDGKDVFPHLSWEDKPKGTESFAISMIEPNTPKGDIIHWIIYDIPDNTEEIRQGAIPESAKHVENSFGERSYSGPCNVSGLHKYEFTVYALDIKHLENVTQENFFEIVEIHSIDKAQLIGFYSACKYCPSISVHLH